MHIGSSIRTTSLLLALCGAFGCGASAPQHETAAGSAPAAVEGEVMDGAEVTDMPAAQRMIIHNATLELRADDPEEVIEHAVAIARAVSGHASGSETASDNGEVQHATATLRVPSDSFEETLQQLREHGELLHESVTGEDVTEQYMDLEARLHAQQTLEKRLLLLVAQASSVEETLEVERELARVRGNVESLDAQTRSLSNRAAMATIELRVYSPTARGSETLASTMADALDDSRELLIGTLGAIVRMFGVVAPLAALGLPILLVVRRRQRRAARQSLPQQIPPQA